jgi:hypothetical protein
MENGRLESCGAISFDDVNDGNDGALSCCSCSAASSSSDEIGAFVKDW